jgi:hypothetical protein
MMKPSKTKLHIVKNRTAGSSYETYEMPQWCSYLLFAARLTMTTMFLVPFLIVVFVNAVLVYKNYGSWDYGLIGVFLVGGCWLAILASDRLREMKAEGVLDLYMADLYARTPMGQYLVKHFRRD